MKKCKKILRGIIVLTIIGIVFVLISRWLLEEQIKEAVQKRIVKDVLRNEALLEEAAVIISKEDDIDMIHRNENSDDDGFRVISCKKFENPSITKVFRKFHLNAIGNRMDGMETPNIDFSVYSYLGLLFPGYSYGFYYSEDDAAVDVIRPDHAVCDTEFVARLDFIGYYYYKTERIAPNWWYYETTITITYNSGRR